MKLFLRSSVIQILFFLAAVPLSVAYASGTPATVVTGSASSVTQTSAVFAATITTPGSSAISTAGIQYGLTTAYGLSTTQTAATPMYAFTTKFSVSTLLNPQLLTTDASGNIYVVDSQGGIVKEYSSTGTFIKQIGSLGVGSGQFSSPQGIAIDVSGNIYVADGDSNVIEKFDSSGNFVSQFGASGPGNGQFNVPIGIKIDSSGNIIVADYGNLRIQKFDSSGNFVSKFALPFRPYDVAVDAAGNYYVNYTNGSHLVQKFDSTGTLISTIGSVGGGSNQYQNPLGITVDAAGNVLLADTEGTNSSVVEFDSSGNFVSKVTVPGYSMIGITTSASGTVYVLNTLNADTSQRFVSSFNYTPVAYSIALTGLACGTTYHYQAIANSGSGMGTGADNTFTTSPCSPVQQAPVQQSAVMSGGTPWFCTDPLAQNYQGSYPGVKAVSGCLYSNNAAMQNTTIVQSPTVTPITIAAPIMQPQTFTMTLSLGTKNPQVTLLQHYLNTHGFAIAKTGIGSLNHENDIFGPATKTAVIAFQKSKRIVAIGVVGPQTRKVLNGE